MITKEIVIDKTEILEDGTIQIREKTRFYEDGVLVSESNTDRRIISPGDDVSKERSEIQSIASVVHTPGKIAAALEKKKKNESTLFEGGKGM